MTSLDKTPYSIGCSALPRALDGAYEVRSDDVSRVLDDRLDQLEVGSPADVERPVAALHAGDMAIDPLLRALLLDLLRREMLEVGERIERVPARLCGIDGAAEQLGQTLDLLDDVLVGLVYSRLRVELGEQAALVLKLPHHRPRRALFGERQHRSARRRHLLLQLDPERRHAVRIEPDLADHPLFRGIGVKA
jgi:hypothetical protein